MVRFSRSFLTEVNDAKSVTGILTWDARNTKREQDALIALASET